MTATAFLWWIQSLLDCETKTLKKLSKAGKKSVQLGSQHTIALKRLSPPGSWRDESRSKTEVDARLRERPNETPTQSLNKTKKATSEPVVK